MNAIDWRRIETSKMKVVRGIIAEWPFGNILSQNRYLSYFKGLKIQMHSVGMIYFVAVLLTNVHTCIYGSNVAEYFDCVPPTLYEYMQCNLRGIPFFNF